MDLHISLQAETLWEVGPIAITNSMLMMFVTMALVLIIFTAIARRAQTVPGRLQSVVEMLMEFLRDLIVGTAGRSLGRKIFPLVSGIFIFILFSNMSGLLPGVGTLGQYEVQEGGYRELIPFMRPPTADLNMNLAMSVLVFVVVQIMGVLAHGFGGRLRHMADPPFIFPIEVLSELSRIISLAARLFGVIFAGEVLLAVMYSIAEATRIALVPVLFPIPFLGLELLFGVIQALVFALLTIVYITLAASHHGDEDLHEEDPPRPASAGRAVPAGQ